MHPAPVMGASIQGRFGGPSLFIEAAGDGRCAGTMLTRNAACGAR